MHCKLRARPGGRNESAGRGALTHPGSERLLPARRPGPGHTPKPRLPRRPGPQNPPRERNCRLRLWGWGRAGLRGVSGPDPCTNARCLSPLPLPAMGSALTSAEPAGWKGSRLRVRRSAGPSHHRARDPADAPRPSSLNPKASVQAARPDLLLPAAASSTPSHPVRRDLSPGLGLRNRLWRFEGRGLMTSQISFLRTHALELLRDTGGMKAYFCAKSP